MSDVIIRPVNIDQDAQGLADMWNASDLQWPGSWNNGVPTTAAMVREWLEEERDLVIYIAEVDGEIAGYCSFETGSGLALDEGYLGLLNVHPKYQKRSIGRKLIQATIDRAVEQGWKRQTLGTWTANFKAVPTYKKTGHFWSPDSAVWMQNFIPGALQMPIAAPFFAKHNWYDSYVRKLEQAEDDERWEGLKVFTQHWEADGEALTIWIDREARAPVAVETDALLVAALAENIEPVTGAPVALRWRVVNKGTQPLTVYLHAQGDKGLSIDHRAAFVVPAGQTVERCAQVKIEPDAASEKDDGTAPAVRSLMRLGDDEVELFTGLRVKKALRLDTAPAVLSLTPGVANALALQLHNERSEPTTLTLVLTPPEGLTLDWGRKQVLVPANGHLTVPLSVTAAEECVYALPVRGEFEQLTAKPLVETLTLYAVGAGGLLAQRAGNAVRLETESVRITVLSKAGEVKFEDKATGAALGSLLPQVGPPYHPTDFRAREFELQVSESAGRVVVSMLAESEYTSGLHLNEKLTFSPTGLVTVHCQLENRSGQPCARRVRLGLRLDGDHTTPYLPLSLGLVRGVGGVYPGAWEDAPRHPAAYSEPWLAWERQGAVIAVGWDGSIDRVHLDWMTTWRSHEVAVGPGERSEALHLALFAASGDWSQARRGLLGWAGAKPEATAGKTRPVALARVEPAVLATTARSVSASLRVDTAANRSSSGQLHLQVAPGLTAVPASVPVCGLNRARPLVQPILLSLSDDRVGAFSGEAHLQLSLDESRSAFSVLRLGTGDAVRVYPSTRSGHDVWVMDNGAAEFIVAPAYGPSVIAWNVHGENQLWSTFPTPQGFSWRYPVFGGLHPLLFPVGSEVWTGYLHHTPATAQPLERRDANDLIWRGVRLAMQPTHDLLKGVTVELDLLTLGGSNVLHSVVRVRNLWDAEQRIVAGQELYAGLGGMPTDVAQHGEDSVRRPSICSAWQEDRPWGALSNPQTGRTLLLVGQASDILLEDAGQHGRLLHGQRDLRLAANEVRELRYYAVLTDSLETARGYLALKDLG